MRKSKVGAWATLWAVTTKKGELLWGEPEACIYESRENAEKWKGSHEVRRIEYRIINP